MKYAEDESRRMEFDNKQAFFDYIWSDLGSGVEANMNFHFVHTFIEV